MTEDTSVVINTDDSPDIMRQRLKLYAGTIYCVDAMKIAMESKTRINMVMLGAIAKVSQFIPLEAVLEMAKETIGKKYPALLEANLTGVRRGYEEMTEKHFSPSVSLLCPMRKCTMSGGMKMLPSVV